MSHALTSAGVFTVLAVAWALVYVGVPANPAPADRALARVAALMVSLLTLAAAVLVAVDGVS